MHSSNTPYFASLHPSRLNAQNESDRFFQLWIWGAVMAGTLLSVGILFYQAGYFSNSKKENKTKKPTIPKPPKLCQAPAVHKTKPLKAPHAPPPIIVKEKSSLKKPTPSQPATHSNTSHSPKKASSKPGLSLGLSIAEIAASRSLTPLESIVDKVVDSSPDSASLASCSSEEAKSPESPYPIFKKLPEVSVRPVILSAESIPYSMKSVLDLSSKLMFFIQDKALRIEHFTKPSQERTKTISTIEIHVKFSPEDNGILPPYFQDFFKKHLLPSASFEKQEPSRVEDEKTIYFYKISSTESIKEMGLALLCLQYILNFTEALQFSVVGSRAARFVGNPTDAASCSRDYDCALFVQLKKGANLISCGSSLGYIFKKMRISSKITDSFALGKKMQVGESFWNFNPLRDPEHQVELKISVDYLEIDSMIAESRKLRHLTVKAAQILIPTPLIQQDAFAIKEFHGQQYYYKSKKLDFTKEAVSVESEAIVYALAYCMLQVQKEKTLFLRPRLVELMLQNMITSSEIKTLKEQAFYQFNKKSLKHSEAAASGAGAPSVEERTFQAVLNLLNAKHQGMPTPERK